MKNIGLNGFYIKITVPTQDQIVSQSSQKLQEKIKNQLRDRVRDQINDQVWSQVINNLKERNE